jgi:antitoxin (DNA-binding transcriptional repressor) of toxin-antitoxin stability system
MKTVNIHEAKAHLCSLVEEAYRGETFVILKDGHPMVKVVALDAPVARQARRLGFMAGQFKVPDDFDQMRVEQIAQLLDPPPQLPPPDSTRHTAAT